MAKIEIPDKVYREIEKRVKESEEFKDVEDYIAFVLSEILKDEEEDEGGEYTVSAEDEEKVKDRLRGLGYL